jgi:hypothetical protein
MDPEVQEGAMVVSIREGLAATQEHHIMPDLDPE